MTLKTEVTFVCPQSQPVNEVVMRGNLELHNLQEEQNKDVFH